tara:strand:- start:172 stop:705 length:534 start_codon:yes stop_codon:yes gene_type:complete
MQNNYSLEKLIDKKSIRKRVEELSREISSYFPDEDELIVICVLNGSILFCSDLIKNMGPNVILDTIRVKSYDKTDKGKLKIFNDITSDIKEKNVLLVEDIVDTGQTIKFLYNHIKNKSPNNIKIVSFLFKPDVYKLNIDINWIGFSVENHFVVGYGLDYDQKFRNFNEVYRLINEEK